MSARYAWFTRAGNKGLPATGGAGANGLFIGLGFQKCATTQLTMRLSKHPEVWTHPVRELCYWNTFFHRRPLPAQTKYLRTFSEPLLEAETTPSDWRKNLHRLEAWVDYAKCPHRGAEDYFRLFENRKPSAAAFGEISPAYARLSAGEIAKMYELLGRPRLFVIMRDPVARALSQVNQESRRHPENVSSTDRQISFLRSDKVREMSDYPRMIAALRALPDQENVGMFFFEDLVQDMPSFFRSFCEFLGVPYRKVLLRDIPHSEERGDYRARLAPAVHEKAAELYGGMGAEVARLLGRTPAAWRVRSHDPIAAL
jgi:hypothetical protein